MVVHTPGTKNPRFLKFGLYLIVAYFITLLLIMKCIPMYSGDARAVTVDTRRNGSARLTSSDPYAVTRVNETVGMLKIVRGVDKDSQDDFLDTDDTDDDIMDCQANENVNSFRKIHGSVYTYSAFLDTRTGDAVVRVLAVVRKGFVDSKLGLFWCHFTGYDEESRVHYSSTKVKFYEMCENHKRDFGGWILTCTIPNDRVDMSEGVFIGYGDAEQESISRSKRICIKAKDKRVSRRKLKYGICVPPLYGDIQPKALVEFVEFHRLVGVDVFTVYVEISNNQVSEQVESVLRFYESRNIMTIIRWQLPVKTKHIWYHGQSLAINDCLYINMYDFDYLSFIDVDEFLVPRGNFSSMDDVIEDISRVQPSHVLNASGYIFKSTLYSPEFSRIPYTEEMTLNVLTNRTKGFSFFRNKVLVRPERIFEMGIHHISKPWPDTANYSIVKVDTKYAHVHHYRECVQEFGVHCESWVEDNTVLTKYGKSLIDNYLKTVYDITP